MLVVVMAYFKFSDPHQTDKSKSLPLYICNEFTATVIKYSQKLQYLDYFI